MNEVIEALGIDKVDTSGQILLIDEQHNSNANFILHAIVSHCRSENYITCFVLFHNTFAHYHNVGMKLGYNLRKFLNETVRIIEPLKMIASSMDKDLGLDLMKKLAHSIREQCINTKKERDDQKIFVIIDDLSHLLDVGLTLEEVWLFLRYLRTFINEEPLMTLVILCHTFKDNCLPNLLEKGLRHFAQLAVTVQPLGAGKATNVSGRMIVSWKSDVDRLKFKWPDETVHLFKLYDRQVKLFEPGSSVIM